MFIGSLHAGVGHTGLDKLLYPLNIPNMSASTYKRYEREIGPIVELVARDSCLEACKEERELTLNNLNELRKRL